jgi:hypothetical protein
MSNFAKLGLKNDGTMGGSGGSAGGSVSINTTYPPTSNSLLTVPSTSVVTSLFNNVANPAGASALGTTATAAVVVGNGLRTLTLNGSSLTVPSNFLIDLSPNVAPTSTSTTTTVTANSLTVAYNKLSGLIDGGNTLITTANTTANSANTLATTANTTANSANTLATTANTTANSANTLATTANTNTNALANTLALITAPATISAFGTVQLSDTYALATYPTGTAPSTQALKQLRIDATTANNTFGTTAISAVTLGVAAQPLSLIGSSLTVPASFLVDLAVSTAPTSTSTTTTATPNSLTNAYNFIVNNRIPAAANLATTAILPVIVGNTAQDLTLNGSTININGAPSATHTMFNVMTSGGSLNICTGSGAATLTIGNTGPLTTNLRGSTVSITGSQINVSTGATAGNTLILGTQNFTNHTIAGNSLTISGLTPNISSITALAVGASELIGLPQEMCIALTSETGAVTVSSAPAAHFRLPRAWRILGVRANLYTPSSSGQVIIDIRSTGSGGSIPGLVSNGSTIFSTTLRIDATRSSSIGSATAAVLSADVTTTGLLDDSGLALFVTSAGTGASGLKVILYYSVV